MTQDCLKQRIASILTGIVVAIVASAAGATAQSARGQTVVVAAASDLQAVLPRLLADFEKSSGIKSTVSFGSSGSLFAQIQNGAPFDVFFSADVDLPRRLVAAGQAEADSLYPYATGRLVLWTRADSGLDVRKGLAIVRDARVRRIALANPEIAPYGRAAVAALKSAKLYDEVKARLVFGDNISQAAQLAQSGNADVGLLAHSIAMSDALKTTGSFSEVPASAYPPIVQAAALISTAKNKTAGRALLAYLKGAEARKTLETFGFGVPPAR